MRQSHSGSQDEARVDRAPRHGAFHQAAVAEPGGYEMVNTTILRANTIDQTNPDTYTFWSRNPENLTTAANVAWILRPWIPQGILAPEC